MTIKPSIFIASSVEGLPVAEAINLILDRTAFMTIWRGGTFRIGSNTLDDLARKSSAVDFAIFIFTPEDVTTIREITEKTVRDNVLFELGLFIGALGKERCYIVRPRGVDMHLPTDLLGITMADYEPDRPDKDLTSALNAACTLIREEVVRHGPFAKPLEGPAPKPHVPNPTDYKLGDIDLAFLGECAATQTQYPEGLGYWAIQQGMGGCSEYAIRASAIKLSKLGYIERSVQTDRDGDNVYSYCITDSGVELFLQNEHVYGRPLVPPRTNGRAGRSAPPAPAPRPAPNFADMDDDVPF